MKNGLRLLTLVTVLAVTSWLASSSTASAYFYPPCSQVSGRACHEQGAVNHCVEGMIPMVCECQPQYGFLWYCMP